MIVGMQTMVSVFPLIRNLANEGARRRCRGGDST
jgi:hypothetical protein